MGRQSATATQQHQATPPSQSMQQGQAGQAAQAQRAQPAPAAPAAAQPARNRWLGPIAGLAAGLGIAALLSHFGLGEAFAGAMANMIMIALIVLAAVMLFRFIMRKRQGNNTPAYAGAGSASGSPYGATTRTSLNQDPPQVPQQPTGFGANYIESPVQQAGRESECAGGLRHRSIRA